jgi:hypothetical protein
MLRVPMYLLLINSLTLGSLIVNFTVLDDPGVVLDHVSVAFTAGLQTSSWLTNTLALYSAAGSDNPAIEPTSGAILIAMEPKANAGGAKGSSMLLYAAIGGGVALVIVIAIVVVCCIRSRRSVAHKTDDSPKKVSPTEPVAPTFGHMPLADTSIGDQSLEIYSRSTEPFFDDSFMDIKVEPQGGVKY